MLIVRAISKSKALNKSSAPEVRIFVENKIRRVNRPRDQAEQSIELYSDEKASTEKKRDSTIAIRLHNIISIWQLFHGLQHQRCEIFVENKIRRFNRPRDQVEQSIELYSDEKASTEKKRDSTIVIKLHNII